MLSSKTITCQIQNWWALAHLSVAVSCWCQAQSCSMAHHGPACFTPPSGLLSSPHHDIVQPEPGGMQILFKSACEGSIQSLQPLPCVQLLAAWIRVVGGERYQHRCYCTTVSCLISSLETVEMWLKFQLSYRLCPIRIYYIKNFKNIYV